MVSQPSAMAWRACSAASACPRVGSAVDLDSGLLQYRQGRSNVRQPPLTARAGERVIEERGLTHQDRRGNQMDCTGRVLSSDAVRQPVCTFRAFLLSYLARGPSRAESFEIEFGRTLP